MVRDISSATASSISGMLTASRSDRCASCRTAITTPPTAISGALTVLALLFVFLWRPPHWIWLMVVVVLLMAGVEAATGRRLTKYLVTVTVFLAFVSSAILIWQFKEEVVFLAVGAVVFYVIIDNLRELSKG